jgi:hypothetical protein
MTGTDSFERVEVRSAGDLRSWLSEHHGQKESVWLVNYKKHVLPKYVSSDEAHDEFRCFVWIDGIRRKLDADRAMQLISPRKARHWTQTAATRRKRVETIADLASRDERLPGSQARTFHLRMMLKNLESGLVLLVGGAPRRTRPGCLLALALFGLVGCDAAVPPEPGALTISGPVRSYLATPEPRTVEFTRPSALTLWRDSLAVADMGGAQVGILPLSLGEGRSLGRRGSGPGEFMSPRAVVARGDELWVFDRRNGRVEIFENGDSVIATIPLQPPVSPPTFAVRGDTVIYPDRGLSHYLVAMAGEERLARVPRPEGARTSADTFSTQNRVVDSGGALWVVDVEHGLIVRDGGRSVVELPDSIRAAARPTIEAMGESLGQDAPVIPVFVAAGPATDGVVVVFIGEETPFGAIIDRAGRVRAIGVAKGTELPSGYPSGVLERDGELILLSDDGVRVYRLAEAWQRHTDSPLPEDDG